MVFQLAKHDKVTLKSGEMISKKKKKIVWNAQTDFPDNETQKEFMVFQLAKHDKIALKSG